MSCLSIVVTLCEHPSDPHFGMLDLTVVKKKLGMPVAHDNGQQEQHQQRTVPALRESGGFAGVSTAQRGLYGGHTHVLAGLHMASCSFCSLTLPVRLHLSDKTANESSANIECEYHLQQEGFIVGWGHGRVV